MQPSWEETIRSLIAGTDRLPNRQQNKDLPREGQAVLLLEQLASLQLLKKAGRIFEQYTEASPECPDDTSPSLTPDLRRDLQMILSGLYRPALPEFVRLMEQQGIAWPPEFLPEALDLCLKDKNIRTFLLPVLDRTSPRARWLAGLHPAWKTFFPDLKVDWATAGFQERLALFSELLSKHPDHAVQMLESTWTEEPAAHRLAFMKLLEQPVPEVVSAFLEPVLTDRSRGVRMEAFRLLSSTPGSPVRDAAGQAALSLLNVWPNWEEGEWWAPLLPYLPNASGSKKESPSETALGWIFYSLPESLRPASALDVFVKQALDHTPVPHWLLEGVAWRADAPWQEAVTQCMEKHPQEPLWRTEVLDRVLSGMDEETWNRAMTRLLPLRELHHSPEEPVAHTLLTARQPWSGLLIRACLGYIESRSPWTYFVPSGIWPQVLERMAFHGDAEDLARIGAGYRDLNAATGTWRQYLDRFYAIVRFRRSMQAHFGQQRTA